MESGCVGEMQQMRQGGIAMATIRHVDTVEGMEGDMGKEEEEKGREEMFDGILM